MHIAIYLSDEVNVTLSFLYRWRAFRRHLVCLVIFTLLCSIPNSRDKINMNCIDLLDHIGNIKALKQGKMGKVCIIDSVYLRIWNAASLRHWFSHPGLWLKHCFLHLQEQSTWVSNVINLWSESSGITAMVISAKLQSSKWYFRDCGSSNSCGDPWDCRSWGVAHTTTVVLWTKKASEGMIRANLTLPYIYNLQPTCSQPPSQPQPHQPCMEACSETDIPPETARTDQLPGSHNTRLMCCIELLGLKLCWPGFT